MLLATIFSLPVKSVKQMSSIVTTERPQTAKPLPQITGLVTYVSSSRPPTGASSYPASGLVKQSASVIKPVHAAGLMPVAQPTGQATNFQDVTGATDIPNVQFTGPVGQIVVSKKLLPALSLTCIAHSQDPNSDMKQHSVVGREKLLIGSAVSRTHSLLIKHRNKHKSSSLTS